MSVMARLSSSAQLHEHRMSYPACDPSSTPTPTTCETCRPLLSELAAGRSLHQRKAAALIRGDMAAFDDLATEPTP